MNPRLTATLLITAAVLTNAVLTNAVLTALNHHGTLGEPPPLQVPGVDYGNFIGYVWLVIFAILILRHSRSRRDASEPVRSAADQMVTS